MSQTTSKPAGIDTTHVSGRRRLRFESYADILADVGRLRDQPTRSLGNWSLAQVCQHLATAMQASTVPGPGFSAPLKLRLVGRLFRMRILTGRLYPGFRLPPEAARLLPPPVELSSAIEALEQAVAHLRTTDVRAKHPVFGAMSVAQWDLFHLRHSEMHLSFIQPETAG